MLWKSWFLVSKALTKFLHSEFTWLRGAIYACWLWLMPICLVLIKVYVHFFHVFWILYNVTCIIVDLFQKVMWYCLVLEVSQLACPSLFPSSAPMFTFFWNHSHLNYSFKIQFVSILQIELTTFMLRIL